MSFKKAVAWITPVIGLALVVQLTRPATPASRLADSLNATLSQVAPGNYSADAFAPSLDVAVLNIDFRGLPALNVDAGDARMLQILCHGHSAPSFQNGGASLDVHWKLDGTEVARHVFHPNDCQ